MMMPKLLLASTTSWPNAARLAAAFTKLSWRVEVLAPSGAPVRRSRFVRKVHDYSAFAPLRSLTRAVCGAVPDLVIPCDDRAVDQLLRLYGREAKADSSIAALIVRSLGAPAHYRTMMARTAFMDAARAEGIAVPRTRSVANEADLEAGLADLGLPLVLKSDGSWGGDGVAIVYTRDEARAAFCRMAQSVGALRSLARAVRRNDAHYAMAAFAPARPRLSIQAFIAGAPATTALACWQGRMLAAIHMDVVASDGGTGPASVVRRVDDPAMEAAAVKLARRFGLSGLHGLDFIRDAAGTVHLLEINPRATQTAALMLGEGRDLPAALAASATGRGVTSRGPAICDDLVALFPQEWLRDPSSPHLAQAHHDVPWDDPALLSACIAPPCQTSQWTVIAGHRPAAPRPLLLPGNHSAVASKP